MSIGREGLLRERKNPEKSPKKRGSWRTFSGSRSYPGEEHCYHIGRGYKNGIDAVMGGRKFTSRKKKRRARPE